MAQVISTVVAYALAIIGSVILYKIISLFTNFRVDADEEVVGLDINEHGERGYMQQTL